jgi:hypothetical protein
MKTKEYKYVDFWEILRKTRKMKYVMEKLNTPTS